MNLSPGRRRALQSQSGREPPSPNPEPPSPEERLEAVTSLIRDVERSLQITTLTSEEWMALWGRLGSLEAERDMILARTAATPPPLFTETGLQKRLDVVEGLIRKNERAMRDGGKAMMPDEFRDTGARLQELWVRKRALKKRLSEMREAEQDRPPDTPPTSDGDGEVIGRLVCPACGMRFGDTATYNAHVAAHTYGQKKKYVWTGVTSDSSDGVTFTYDMTGY